MAAAKKASPAAAAPAVAAGSCAIGVSTDVTKIPTVSIPSCAKAPTALQITDVVAGSGQAAKAGDSVTVKYLGAHFTNGQTFDASWTDGAPGGTFTVTPLGQAQVITGWNQGLIGAKVGGRRLLVIPPDLGYGAEGAQGAIAPNETLIFVVDIVSITLA